jgi:hypothetical protein
MRGGGLWTTVATLRFEARKLVLSAVPADALNRVLVMGFGATKGVS